jgi:hypothetical protein
VYSLCSRYAPKGRGVNSVREAKGGARWKIAEGAGPSLLPCPCRASLGPLTNVPCAKRRVGKEGVDIDVEAGGGPLEPRYRERVSCSVCTTRPTMELSGIYKLVAKLPSLDSG